VAQRFRQDVALGGDHQDVLAGQLAGQARDHPGLKVEQIDDPQHQAVHAGDLRQHGVRINAGAHRDAEIIVMHQPETSLAVLAALFRRIARLIGIRMLNGDAATFTDCHNSVLSE